MSTDTDAILCYGIDLGENILDYFPDFGTEDKLFDFIDNYDEVELEYHGAESCPFHILLVPGTDITAYRGYPKHLAGDYLEVDQKKVDAFKKWISDHGIDPDRAGWILCSWWG